MYQLVADIEAYPQFVPLCASMAIDSRNVEDGKEIVVAKMTVAYSLLHETFTSRVVLDPDALAIDVTGIDGPFSKMDNSWRFETTGPASCKILFNIDFEFRSRPLGLLLGGLFDPAFRRFAAAFEARANAVYGA
jgi:coenzyme Q-binding protein COQ10